MDTPSLGGTLEGGFKSGSERCDGRVISGKHAPLDEDCQSRSRIKPAKILLRESPNLDDFLIGSQPRDCNGTEPGIGRLHLSQRNLLEQLDQRIRLSDGADRTLESFFIRLHHPSVHGTGARPPRISAGPTGTRSARRDPTRRSSNAERRELFRKLGRLALWASHYGRALHQQLESVIAILTDIFEDRHRNSPS